MNIQTPAWVKQAVFYQIFPDRFARSPKTKHPRGITFKPWGSPPEEQGYQGGDLYGIVEKLDYLQELGITALYLMPIFASASNHRYHTYDYFMVDPLLGGNEAMRLLVDEAHARDMRIVLDGVFNHASRGFWAFHHILENGDHSPYRDWFIVEDWPLNPYPKDGTEKINYAAWWGMPALPKFNIANPGVRDYLLGVAHYWIDFGVDGWRLDVPEEIKDEAFWQDFRKVVKAANPDAYLVGEIWHAAQDWLRGDRFDAVMNYIFSRAALGFFAAETLRMDYHPGGFHLTPLTAPAFAKTVEQMLSLYPWPIIQSQLNLMDSHDTARTLWMVNGDKSALRLCTLFQMTMPGAPCIYYGDEIGMTGATDPYCRAAFPWQDRPQWDEELLAFHRRAIAMRHAYPVLSQGDFETIYADHTIYAFRRTTASTSALIILNAGVQDTTIALTINALQTVTATYTDVWHTGEYQLQAGQLDAVTVPPRDALVLIHEAS
ncbi:MAG: glycoside hydrolase family 13 protein [Caldilineaceae bacterium]|nr:glycoside hydrolase family 13 protein [Caldilineaceae bacterium]